MSKVYDWPSDIALFVEKREMGSLQELLISIFSLPASELRAGQKTDQRPNELRLLEEIISAERIQHWRETYTYIKRACFTEGPGQSSIRFHVIKGGLHKVTATYKSSKGVVTISVKDGETILPIETVEELRAYIIKLVEDEPDTT